MSFKPMSAHPRTELDLEVEGETMTERESLDQAGCGASGELDAAAVPVRLGAPIVLAPFLLAVIGLAFVAYPLGGKALLAAFVGAVLIVVAAFDIEHRIVPNRIVLPAFAVVLAAQAALSPVHITRYVLAGLLAALVLAAPRVFNRDSVGAGDVKLALLLGAALGWGVFGALIIAFLCVFPIAVALLIRGGAAARKASIPMAPFLALGALIVLLAPAFHGTLA
jgi:leader peptidase (prepilin peptidase)/N-methyltransferase